MQDAKRRRRVGWRTAGKGKSERTLWWLALVATLIVIAVTLVAGHLRKQSTPALRPGGPAASGAASDDQ